MPAGWRARSQSTAEVTPVSSLENRCVPTAPSTARSRCALATSMPAHTAVSMVYPSAVRARALPCRYGLVAQATVRALARTTGRGGQAEPRSPTTKGDPAYPAPLSYSPNLRGRQDTRVSGGFDYTSTRCTASPSPGEAGRGARGEGSSARVSTGVSRLASSGQPLAALLRPIRAMARKEALDAIEGVFEVLV